MTTHHDFILNELKPVHGDALQENVPLREHCTYKIGGPADFLLELRSTEGLARALEHFHARHIPVMALGWGSNVLFPDEGFKGLVIKVRRDDIVFDGEKVHAGAGAMLPRLAHAAAEQGLTGLEFSGGIPGTVGGAVIMNAGLKDASIGDVVTTVKGIDLSGTAFEIDREHIGFKYRASSLRNTRKLITDVELKLNHGYKGSILKRMSEYAAQRKAFQPLEYPSAGSVFKNPPEKPAWQLIDEAGCRGLQIGKAQVSEKHCNFIVNLGGAAYDDVARIIDTVVDRVMDSSGVMLELEILDLGKHPQRRKES